MRRKRRNRSTWFPVLGTEPPETSPSAVALSYYNAFTDIRHDYQIGLISTPLIPDQTSDSNDSITGANVLRDFVEGQTCVIERIVGKIVCSVVQEQSSSPETISIAANCICCAAIAVFPVSNDDNALELNDREINPLLAENLDKPWLWRRTWVLSNNMAVGAGQTFVFNNPASNEFFASRDDGPHVDTKGVRRAIQRNQRLYLVLASASVTPADPQEDGTVYWTTDLRVLGQMRRAKNKSLFT